MSDEHEAELRSAVRSYAEEVQPGSRLDAIRDGTRARASGSFAGTSSWWNRPWVLAGGAALVASSVVAGAVLLGDSGPGGEVDRTAAGSDAQRRTVVYQVQVLESGWLNPVEVPVARSGDPAVDAVRAWLADRDTPGSVFDILGSVGVASVAVDGGRIVVDFTGPVEDPWPDREPGWAYNPVLVGQSLAWTVQGAIGSTDAAVEVTVDGEPAKALLEAPLAGPITPDPRVLSPVVIDAPADGATVSSPLRVEGTSDTFEANVVWEVGGDGIDKGGFAMGGTLGERAPFRFGVVLPPGDYTVRAYAESAEDGSLFAEDTVHVTVE